MSVKENLELVDSFIESYNARSWSAFSDLHSETVLMIEPGMEPYRGKDALMRSYLGMLTVFPDARMKKVLAFGQRDMVCFEIVASGTHKGPLLGPDGKSIPPTNREIRVEIVAVAKIRDGRIVEFHESYDRLGLLLQIGAS